MLHAHLSNLSRRAFVIPPYFANEHHPLGDDQVLHVPSSAFSYSPLTGAPFPGSRGYDHLDPPDEQVLPRSVSEAYYNSVCPEERRVKLDVHKVCAELGLDMKKDGVKVIAEAWAKKLLAMDDGCVDVIGHPLFDYMYMSLHLFPHTPLTDIIKGLWISRPIALARPQQIPHIGQLGLVATHLHRSHKGWIPRTQQYTDCRSQKCLATHTSLGISTCDRCGGHGNEPPSWAAIYHPWSHCGSSSPWRLRSPLQVPLVRASRIRVLVRLWILRRVETYFPRGCRSPRYPSRPLRPDFPKAKRYTLRPTIYNSLALQEKRGRDDRSDNPHARRTHRIPLLAKSQLDTGQTACGTRMAKGKEGA
jgi:hypothetical protein